MQERRDVADTTASLNQIDVVDAAGELLQKLALCWDACSPSEHIRAKDEDALTCMDQVLACIRMVVRQLPRSNKGKPRIDQA
jgi:hypothetical protein